MLTRACAERVYGVGNDEGLFKWHFDKVAEAV